MANATDLHLLANGDWPTLGKCVILQPAGLYFAKNVDGSDDDALDTIVFVVLSKENFTVTNDIGLSIAMWDGNVPMVDQQPIWTGIPSVNTLTFIYSEHILLTQAAPQTHYTLQKQNLRTMQAGFYANPLVIGRIVISPDTFFVTRYLDKPSYTWVDLVAAFGGMASIAIAVWIFLFGSGKYKSWGIMQRYILRTSPNSTRYSEKDAAPKSPYESVKQFLKRQISRMDSSADHELDDAPLHPTIQERRRLSTRYSTAMNLDTAATAAAVATGVSSGVGQRVSKVPNLSPLAGEFDRGTRKYSMESSSGPSNYYFSEYGAPGSRSLQPLAPISEGEDDVEEQVSELIRLIDLRVDERMWSLERTLSRFYLDGFRLRNYSSQYNGERYYPQFNGKDEETGQNDLTILADRHAQQSLLQGRDIGSHPPSPASFPPSPASPPGPSYPPRPKLNLQYEYIDEATIVTPPTPGKQDISQVPAVVIAPSAPAPPPSSSSSSSRSPPNNMLTPVFPQRRDMRGTIRRAVERLQNEWPQSPGSEPYVPRTQYQGRNTEGTPDYNPPQY
ncbi:hypothetical protein EDD21DRAFT_392566 [Dissophora ornata]|nr:hypothetical protein EDD21DRAFT_392566 [Dissophora ornata]